jgi:hypothetical protein
MAEVRVRYFTYAERPDLVDRYRVEGEDFWGEGMAWINHDPVCELFWGRLSEEFADYQFLVYDEASDRFLAHANTIPFRWDETREGLPDGVDGVLPRAFEQRAEGIVPNTLCALLAAIQPRVASTGLSRDLLEHIKVLARRSKLGTLVAPVRPNQKARYPLTPMERYVRWRRDDGLLLDPWLRTHERLGAQLYGICPNSNVFRGSVAGWESWTGLVFPDSGDYVVPGALALLQIDRENDEGVLVEPNVWMKHDV